MARSTYTMKVPSSTRHLEEVRRFVASHAAAADFPEQTVEAFKLAVDEACTNVIKHAYKGKETHQIDVAVIIDTDRFTVRIQDRGEAFHPDEYQEPDIFTFARQGKSGGFGVHIMRRLMDHVEYRTRGRINEVRLTKYRADEDRAHNGTTS